MTEEVAPVKEVEGGGMIVEAFGTAAAREAFPTGGVAVASTFVSFWAANEGDLPRALAVLGADGLACGAGLGEAFVGDCLAAAGGCREILPGDFVLAAASAGGTGVAADGAGLGLGFAPRRILIGAALGARLIFSVG